MTVRVEFYGIPRQRAGVASLDVSADCVGTALRRVAEVLPEFAAACVCDGVLRPGLLANVNGAVFTTETNDSLADGDVLLIMSADAGG